MIKCFRFLRLQEQRGAYECGEADNFYLPESEIRLFLMQYDFVNVCHTVSIQQPDQCLFYHLHWTLVCFS
jgi:hypothetical protein